MAQAPTLQATVDRTSIGLSESVTLTVTASGSTNTMAEPVLPNLPDFDVSPAGTFTMSNVVVNGTNEQVSASRSWNYTLFPKKAGRFTIGPITLQVEGRTLKSRPIQVTVTGQSSPSSSPPSVPADEGRGTRDEGRGTESREPLFVEATVDPRKLFVNEQVTLTIAAYSQYPGTFNVGFGTPELSGFRVYRLKPQPAREEQVGGEQYVVERQSYVLFPLQSGKLTIPSVPVQFELDFFTQREARSRPLTLDVRPLPKANAPRDFHGAVGQFRISAKVDKTTVPAGEPINLSAEITGTGDFKTVPKIELPNLPNFQRFDQAQKEDPPDLANGRVIGRKTAEVVLVPQQPGNYSLGPLRLRYFDPALGQYRTATSDVLRLTVTPGAAPSDTTAAGFAPERVKIIRKDIRYLKPDLAQVRDESQLTLLRPTSLALHALPLLALLTLAGIKRRREILAMDTPHARVLRSSRAAQKWLREASALVQPAHSLEFHAAVARGLAEYVATQINVPAPSISSDTISDQLVCSQARSVSGVPFPTDLAESLRDCLARCEFARFSGSAVTEEEMQATLEQARRIITEWERTRRKK